MANKRRHIEAKDLETLNTSLEDVLLTSRVASSNSWAVGSTQDLETISNLVGEYSNVDKYEKTFSDRLAEHVKEKKAHRLESVSTQCKIDGWNEGNQILADTVKDLELRKKRLEEERAAILARSNAKKKELEEENKKLRAALAAQIEDEVEIEKLDSQLSFKTSVLDVLQSGESDLQSMFQSGKFKVTLDKAATQNILNKLKADLERIEEELRKEIEVLKEDAKRNEKRGRKKQRRVAQAKFEKMKSVLETEKGPVIDALKKNIDRLEKSLKLYQEALNRKLISGGDVNRSLRMEIKAYELLVKSECERLDLPLPKFDHKSGDADSKMSTEFSLYAESSQGRRRIKLRNTSAEDRSLKGYFIRSTKTSLAFPPATTLASGKEIYIYWVSALPSDHLKSGDYFIKGAFETPEDHVNLIDPEGNVIYSEQVFAE